MILCEGSIMRQRIGVWLASLLIVLPSAAMALGLGKIELKSALNQPLDGVIPLLSVREKDLEHLKVRLASPDDFKRAGIERPYFLSKIKFDIVQEKNKKYIVKIATKDSIQEPFLNFLVEVRWASGKMLREFTVLLDPPVTASSYQKPGASKVKAKPKSVERATKKPSKPKQKASKGVAVSKRTKISTESRSGVRKSSGRGAASGTYKVRSGQTLWKIAREVRDRDNQSVEQMMMALYKNNPDAFNKNNMNALLAGRVLDIPSNQQVQELSTSDAKKAVREQARAWRKGLSSPSTSKAPAQKDTAKQSKSTTAKRTVGRIEVVAPSKDTVAGDKSVQASGEATAKDSAEITRLRSELAAAQKAMDEQKTQNDDLQSNVNELEGKIKSLERLLALKDQEMARLQSKISGQPQDQVEIVAEPEEVEVKVEETKPEEIKSGEVTADKPEEVKPEEAKPEESQAEGQAEEVVEQQPEEQVPEQPKRPEPKAPEMPKDVKAEVKSTLMDDPKIWAIASGAILAILILIWIIVRSMFRRGEYSEADLEESGVSTVITSVEGEEEVGFSAERTAEAVSQYEAEPQAQQAQASEDDEPSIVREADVYVAYGRASQAIEKLQIAKDENPDNLKIRYKLLEVLSQTEEVEQFDKEAKAYFELINDPSDDGWLEIVEMGQKLSPESPLYKEAESIMETQDVSIDDLLEEEDDLGGEDLEIDLDDDLLSDEAAELSELEELSEPEELSVGETFEEEPEVDFTEGTDITEELAEGEDLEEIGSDDFDMSLDFETDEEPDAAPNADEQKLAYETSESDIDELADLEFELDTLDEELDVENDAGEKIDSTNVDLEGGMEEPAYIENTFTEEDLSEEISEKDLVDLDVSDIGGEMDEDLAELDEMDDFSDLEIGDDDLGLDDLDEDDDLIIDDSDEISTKLDLAKAYIDMGDIDGAKSILSEVVADGNDEQKEEAQKLIDEL